MKTIFRLNQVFFIITLALYITVFGGLLAQILLGAIQLLSAAYLWFKWNVLNKTAKIMLSSYTGLTTIYLCLFYDEGHWQKDVWVVFYIVVPMLLATFFTYITYYCKDFKENKKAKEIHPWMSDILDDKKI